MCCLRFPFKYRLPRPWPARHWLPIVLNLIVFGMPVCWAGNLDSKHTIELSSKHSLSTLLAELGRQTNTTILIIGYLPKNSQNTLVKERSIKGYYSVRQALDLILQDTSYQYKQVGKQSVSVIRKPPKESTGKKLASSEPPVLEIINVIGRPITGSHIRKAQVNAIAPLDIITAEQLSRSGTQSLADLLKFIPAVSGNSTNTAVSNGGDGTTKVALRGLPANNTLVLINGQRAVFDGLAGDSVDLNTVAPIAIQYLEIYKDGASAIYGSDAIAGVVNIRMLEEYEGIKLEHYSGITGRGDTYTRSTNGLWGMPTKNGSILVSASYFDQEGLYSRDRKLSASANQLARGGRDNRTSATPYTRVTTNGERLILRASEEGLPGADNETSLYRPVTQDDLFDFYTQTSTISPSTRLGLYGNILQDINENLSFKSFALYSRTKAKITLASSPIYTITALLPDPIVVSKDQAYNPFGEDITDLRRRLVEFEPRGQVNETESLYTNVGFHYEHKQTLIQTNFYWNATKAQEARSNLVDSARLARALGPTENCQGREIDGCLALNIFALPGEIPQSQLDFIRTQEQAKGKSRIYGFSAQYNSEGNWHNQKINYAMGLDIRNERSKFSPKQAGGNNTIGSVTKTPTNGSREVFEAFTELYLPFFNKNIDRNIFDIELALRYTKSTDVGENAIPKIGARLSLSPGIFLRTTYSRGFREPSIRELNTDGTFEFSSLEDPCAIESNVYKLMGCTLQSDPSLNQFLVRYSGFRQLEPELSENYILGLHVTPPNHPHISFSADAYAINIDNVINSSPQTIIDENARTGAFADFVDRNSDGNITLVRSPYVNIGDREVKGIDVNLSYQAPSKRTSISFNSSYIYSYRNKISESAVEEDLAGTFRDAAESGDGSLPRWKANIGIYRSIENWSVSYAIKYIGSMRERFRKGAQGFVNRRIPSWTTHNLQIGYSHQNLPFYGSLGIDNIFDKPPPFIASAFNDNYDARTYDLKGRYFYATLGIKF